MEINIHYCCEGLSRFMGGEKMSIQIIGTAEKGYNFLFEENNHWKHCPFCGSKIKVDDNDE